MSKISTTSPPPEVSIRQIGRLKCAVVDAGHIHWMPPERGPYSWRSADVPIASDGRAEIGVNWLAISAPDAIVLVDPVTWDEHEDLGDSEIFPNISLNAALQALKFDASEVTDVVLTHWHLDHLTGLVDGDRSPRFADATHHVPKSDWQILRDTADGNAQQKQIVDVLQRLDTAGKLAQSASDVEVTPEIHLQWTGGETPGHQILHAVSDGADMIHLGDLVHFPNEVEHPEWVALHDRDEDEVLAARQHWFAHAAAHSSLVVFTHGRYPAWGRFEATDNGWAWRYEPV